MRKKAKLLDEGWKEYRENVISPDAHVTQLIECKRAFYAGARTLLTDILSMLDPGEEPTEDDLLMMDDIEAELEQFSIDVLHGKE